MYKKNFLKRKNLITTIVTVFLVVISLISSSSMSATISNISENKNLDLETVEEKTSIVVKSSTDLAPKTTQKNLISATGKTNYFEIISSNNSLERSTIMYAYMAYPGGGPCYFYIDSPGGIVMLSNQTVPNFASGGTWTCDEKWIVCAYGNGALYEIDTITGDITEIGGGGVNLNGLAYDKITNLMYGAGDTSLYLIDMYTGEQELIGPFGSDVWYIIGIAFDSNGVLYGWSLNDYLWTINTSTGDATQVGQLGINLNYAQDGDFDRNNGDILYLTAFTLSPSYGSFLYTCNAETGECTLVGTLGNGFTELDASMIKYTCVPPEHDVGVTNISEPDSGPAKMFSVNATIKNFGQNNECCFRAYVEITELNTEKENNVECLTQDFSDSIFLRTGWTKTSGLLLFEPEYQDFVCISEIDAGQEINISFDNWTPAYLAEETSGTKIYSVKAWTDMNDPPDENPDNDLFEKTVELDFFHDVGIKEVTSPNIYINLGNQNISATIENIGTFPEQDMICYAEIYEFYTNCSEGTLIYEDNITDIDILTPLTGTKTLTFDDYNFAVEGLYTLDLNLVDDNDDYPDNNQLEYMIGCDSTPPETTHKLNPNKPDGLNGWYISDVEVTLTAADPSIGCDSDGSGVKEINYQVDGGAVQTLPGDTGVFVVITDSTMHTIKYWSIDNVGNTESQKTIQFKQDQTPPEINFTYTWSGKKAPYTFIFTAYAADATSGMQRVEFWQNWKLQETIIGPGPYYIWQIKWVTPSKTIFRAIAYDFAGLSAYADIEEPKLSKNRNINPPFLSFMKNFIQSHPNLLPILRLILRS